MNDNKFSDKYVPKSLSKEDAKKQSADIKKTAMKVREKQPLTKGGVLGTLKKEDFERPKVDYPTRKSSYTTKFEKKYGIKVSMDAISEKFNIPKTALKQIYDKGVGAFLSDGSRPNVNAFQWGYARIASVLLGGKARNIDKSIVEKYNLPLL